MDIVLALAGSGSCSSQPVTNGSFPVASITLASVVETRR